jgi:hypothetical protein
MLALCSRIYALLLPNEVTAGGEVVDQVNRQRNRGLTKKNEDGNQRRKIVTPDKEICLMESGYIERYNGSPVAFCQNLTLAKNRTFYGGA